MMETLTDLKRTLLYSKLELKEALIRFHDLGKEIDCPFMTAWATMEMFEYSSGNEVSDYRLYSKTYSVNFNNGQEIFRNFPVPSEALFPEEAEARWTFYNGPVTGFYEEYRLEDGELHLPANELKSQIHDFLTGLFGPDIVIIGVAEVIPAKVFRKIILASEEIMINFLVNLESQFGPHPSFELLRLYDEDILALFLKAFMETGRANHLDLHIKYKPIDLEGYHDAIFELYDDCEVPDDEIDEGFDLIERLRGSVSNPENLGAHIEDYIERMAGLYPKFGYKGVKLKKTIIAYYGLDKNKSG